MVCPDLLIWEFCVLLGRSPYRARASDRYRALWVQVPSAFRWAGNGPPLWDSKRTILPRIYADGRGLFSWGYRAFEATQSVDRWFLFFTTENAEDTERFLICAGIGHYSVFQFCFTRLSAVDSEVFCQKIDRAFRAFPCRDSGIQRVSLGR